MSRSLTSQELGAVLAPNITTAVLARLDFESESVCIWTGAEAQGFESADSLLDGQTFDPLVHGVVVDIGENSFTSQGSEALRITLALPAAPSAAITAAMYLPAEYRGRRATIWRALMIASPLPGQPPVWAVRLLRTGSMDLLEVADDGMTKKFTLTIESHAARISNATGSTYLDQKRLDPADTSQDFAVASANGSPAPTASSTVLGNTGGGGGGFWNAAAEYARQHQ